MKRIALLIVLLLAVAAHAEETPVAAPATQEQLQKVEQQLVQSGVSEADAQATMRAMMQARFTGEQMVQAGRQIVSDDHLGITGQAVRAKIHEGVAKGVPPEAILSATARVRSRMEYSGKLAAELQENNNASLVATYADCLAAGLTEQHAQQLTTALKSRTGTPGSSNLSLTTETLLTAREMVRRNISSATTSGVLGSALGHGYNERDMHTLRQSFAGSSGDLENTARRFGAAIDQGVRAGELQGLGNSSRGTGEKSGGVGGGQGASGSSGSGGSGGGGNSGGGRGGRS